MMRSRLIWIALPALAIGVIVATIPAYTLVATGLLTWAILSLIVPLRIWVPVSIVATTCIPWDFVGRRAGRIPRSAHKRDSVVRSAGHRAQPREERRRAAFRR